MTATTIPCLIVEDEPLAQERLADYVRRLPVLELRGTVGSAAEALAFTRAEPVRLVFLDVNLGGTFHTLKCVVPHMIEQGRGGAIVVVSSVAGLRGLPYLADYVASKHAITGLARTVGNEVAQYRIRVNTIHPAAVPTGMVTPGLVPLVMEDAHTLAPIFMNALPAQHTEPEDIAAAVAWLCSPDATAITGQSIAVAGGEVM